MNKKLIFATPIFALAALATAGLTIAQEGADSENTHGRRDRTFTVDVALDSSTLVVNHVDPTQPPTTQFRGDTLVIDGTIYEKGTVPSGISDFDPATPGIGKIRCRASILVPLTDLTSPAASFVTEWYSLPDDNQIIIADGPGANLYAMVQRAVLGGTRHFEGVSGQLSETNLGLNKSGACDLRVTFRLKNVKHSSGADHD